MDGAPRRLAYLGPEGTLTHDAAGMLRGASRFEPVACATTDEVFAVVASGHAGSGVVPWESSAEGGLASTIDALIFDADDLRIVEEVVMPVRFGAWSAGVVEGDAPRAAVSHPFALAQCHRFTSSRGLATQAIESTAAACALVAERGDPALVAIASAGAAARYGLTSWADDIGDLPDDQTRFVRVGRERPEATGDDHTTLVLVPPDDRTGVLVRMLRPFSTRDLDVASIVTRPLKSSLGQYCFVVTCRGHSDDPAVQGAIDELLSGAVGVKHLGSYPAWKVEHRPFDHLPPGTIPGRRSGDGDG